MSFRLQPLISSEEWASYIKASLLHICKRLKTWLGASASDVSTAKSIELVYQFNRRMEETLGYRSLQETRFMPKFSRYLFFDVDKDGSLQVILEELYQRLAHLGLKQVEQLSPTQFRDLYTAIYRRLQSGNFIQSNSFYIDPEGIKEAELVQLLEAVKYFKQQLADTPDAANVIIRRAPQNAFIPHIPSDLVTAQQRVRDGRPPGPNYADLNRPVSRYNYLLRLTEHVNAAHRQRQQVIAHCRCTPQDYDVSLSLKDFVRLRMEQTGCQNALQLDQFVDSCYHNGNPQSALVVPPAYLFDSMFFNEPLIPQDYVNSMQESKLEACLGRLREAQNAGTDGHSGVQPAQAANPVDAWKWRLRQAQNKPVQSHALNSTLVRGFEAYNQKQLTDVNAVYAAQPEKEQGTHLGTIQASGVLLAGLPVNQHVRGRPTEIGRGVGRSIGRGVLQLNVRYYQQASFSVQVGLLDCVGVLGALGCGAIGRACDAVQKGRARRMSVNRGDNAVNDRLTGQLCYHAVVQQQRLLQLEARGIVQIRIANFDPAGIAPQEVAFLTRTGLPLTHDDYRYLRNTIICSYRLTPHLYLRASAIAAVLPRYDYITISKTVAYLTEVGAINIPILVAQSTAPVSIVAAPVPCGYRFRCTVCHRAVEEAFYETYSGLNAAAAVHCLECAAQQPPTRKYIRVNARNLASTSPDFKLALLSEIKATALSDGITGLFSTVARRMHTTPEYCLQHFMEMVFGTPVDDGAAYQRPVSGNSPSAVVARAVVQYRSQIAHGLLDLQRALEQDE